MMRILTCLFFLCCIVGDSGHLLAQKKEWKLVFSDEFNQPNGSQPDPEKWGRGRRGVAMWNRWISHSERVVYIKNGCLVCRAIPNKYEKTDTARMLTGAVSTKGKFHFTYGKVEVRMKVKPREGSFPAAWMMGVTKENPDWYREIDIVEVMGTQHAHNTAFAHLTVVAKRKDGPKHHFKESLDVEQWHVYGLEWSPTELVWTIDGKVTGVYRKSSDQSLLKDGQWPYDYPMDIILNQSVGDYSWSSKPNYKKTYETQFDWVRVYQLK